jgi:hypothetical protein
MTERNKHGWRPTFDEIQARPRRRQRSRIAGDRITLPSDRTCRSRRRGELITRALGRMSTRRAFVMSPAARWKSVGSQSRNVSSQHGTRLPALSEISLATRTCIHLVSERSCFSPPMVSAICVLPSHTSYGRIFSTRMLIDEVAELPDVSRATASSRCGPSPIPVQSHVVVYGDAVTGDPIATPSTKNWMVATSTLSAARVTEPETVESFDGAMKDIDGEVTSRLPVDSPTETVTRIVELPRCLLVLPTTATEKESDPIYFAREVYRKPGPSSVT